ncbi:hypothetical protein [Shinella zoogloeoides]|uniref:hypothetical protein n=1 Tax=Shinella zoogloeoides TaxID=352475 RepID=UPI0028A6E246|nr:hypothetical protein [Shinella zoogloeoides]
MATMDDVEVEPHPQPDEPFRNHSGFSLFNPERGANLEESMDRRSFLTGLLGLAGTAALASVIKPEGVQAAIINPGDIGSGNGILDELQSSEPDVMEVSHRRGHWPRHHRPHRRRVWRRVCRRARVHGRWRRRCWRERVWI